MARTNGCVCYSATCVVILALILPFSDSTTNGDLHAAYSVAGINHAYITEVRSLSHQDAVQRVKRQATATTTPTPAGGTNSTSSTNGSNVSTPAAPVAVPTLEPGPPALTPTPAPPPTTTQRPPATTPAPTTPTPQPTTSAQPPQPTTARPLTTTQAPATGNGSTLPPIYKDNHSYYMSSIQPDEAEDYFFELDSPSSQGTLNSGHRLAVTIALPFKFRFYGHNITNITVATGGFIYMSPFLHQWLTATQYIAPLMANFETSSSADSNIFYKQVGDEFVIEWHNARLKDQPTNGPFVFQTKLKSDGTITFVYKRLPIAISEISSENHPVKIGLSDAFYNDTFLPQYGIKRRTIIEYHRVSFSREQVEEGTVIVLQPLPTCNIISDCGACTKHEGVKFECKWCSRVSRCSDGLDWYRQDWEKQGCKATKKGDGKCESGKTNGGVVAAVVVVLVLVALLVAGAVWVYYGYTHPTTPSGMWLMEHRPSQMKAKLASMKFWKKSTPAGTKYAVESDA